MKSKTILLGLNELNFDYINYYVDKGLLPNFKTIFKIQKPIETISEEDFDLLEPWIQWVSIHTGKLFKDHKVFRLGDIVNNPNLTQIYEELEIKGLKVGAVSPFNADNRLKEPAFFIPDPWTKTKTSGNWIIKSLSNAVSQSVNDNAQGKINLKSFFSIIIGLIVYIPVNRWMHYVKCLIKIKTPGNKALVLDSLLSDLFIKLFKKHKPEFSELFLNSGAHIQHHYLFNSKAYKGDLENPDWYCEKKIDPLINILTEYDRVIGRLLKQKGIRLLILTGLHQQPHKKLTFYWRIKNHANFLRDIGINTFSEVIPRMSRDFLIKFLNEKEAFNAEEKLNDYYFSSDDGKIFSIDNRGDSLFIELIYPNNIDEKDSIYAKKTNEVLKCFKSYLSFVAIKNGEHNGIGYLTANFKLNIDNKLPIDSVKDLIINTSINKKD